MTVEVIDPATGLVRTIPLVLDDQTGTAEINLEVAPGARYVQVVARNETGVEAWIEVAAQPGEQVSVEFKRSANGELRAFSRNRVHFLVLPNEAPPPPLVFKPSQTDELDVVVLVDGTCLHPYTSPGSNASTLEYLLAPELADVWQGIARRIAEFVKRISEKYPKLWTMAVAFGDQPMPLVSNEVLKPKYVVQPQVPDQRKLEPSTVDQLLQQLRRLPPTPGGDFVDALADGLHACAQARWRQNSRKLLLIFGQSPGYSLSEAWDDMTNLLVRKTCLEEEAATLHRMGVEIATIYHDPPVPEEVYRVQLPELFDRSRKQYQEIATLREWSCLSLGVADADIDIDQLAAAWLKPPISLARGPSPGVLASGVIP